MSGIIAVFPPNTQCSEGILVLETETEGHLIYIFFSKEQGRDLIERYRTLCEKEWRLDTLERIQLSGAPEQSDRDLICIIGCSARSIASAVETLIRTGAGSVGGNPNRNTDWSFSVPNNTQAALDTKDGLTVLQRGTTHHLYVFYSKEQAREIVARHMTGAASKHTTNESSTQACLQTQLMSP